MTVGFLSPGFPAPRARERAALSIWSAAPVLAHLPPQPVGTRSALRKDQP